MCWEGKAKAEGVGWEGGNQIQLEGGLYLDSSKDPELVLLFGQCFRLWAVLVLTLKRPKGRKSSFFFLTIQQYLDLDVELIDYLWSNFSFYYFCLLFLIKRIKSRRRGWWIGLNICWCTQEWWAERCLLEYKKCFVGTIPCTGTLRYPYGADTFWYPDLLWQPSSPK